MVGAAAPRGAEVASVLGAIGTGREKAAGLGVGTRREDRDGVEFAASRGVLPVSGGVTFVVFTADGSAERPLREAVTTCGPSELEAPGAGTASFRSAETGEIRTGRSSGAAGRISTGFLIGAVTES